MRIFNQGREKLFWSVPVYQTRYSSRFLRKETQSNATQSNAIVIVDQ